MPEGDVVWWYARRLHGALAGQVLTRSDFRVPRFATADLTGRIVTQAVSRGKHLLIRVEGGVTVHTHLRMDGSWRIRPAAEPVPVGHRVRLLLANDAWITLGYQLGIVEVLPTVQEQQVTGHLGPDPLGPDWDPDEVVRRLGARPQRRIGEALLDQGVVAGIGNLYKSEVLFLRGIDPWCKVGRVQDLAAAVALAQRLLDANKDRIGQVTTGVARRGEETWVYGRAGLPCRRCHTPVRMATQGEAHEERVTFWCPSCQR
jgi:endonuclease-8